MASPRDAILKRLRTARASARIPRVDAVASLPIVAAPLAECLERFQQETLALGVECFIESDAAAVRARVQSIVGTQRVLSWDSSELPYDVGGVLVEPTLGSAPRDRQAAAEIGVTGCDAAIAETGTLAMLSAPGRSRVVSLLPPVHLAVVQRRDLCFTMAEFFERYASQVAAASSCTFITGPSRTADIELTLTLGIHGPGRVIVVIGD